MAEKQFQITGQVVEKSTGNGLPNYKVEAWDKDSEYHNLLGVAISGPDGGFRIEFDTSYFGHEDPEGVPDVFFRVFLGKKLVLNMEDELKKYPIDQKKVVLPVELSPPRPEAEDRLGMTQAFKAVEFFQGSDVKGTVMAFQKRTGTSFGLFSDILKNSLNKFDWDPIQPSVSDSDEILEKDTASVREVLARRKVEVVEVRPYDPRLNAGFLKDIVSLPTKLKEGQRVQLYEENGKVKYYALAEEAKGTPPGTEKELKQQSLEIAKMKEELSRTQKVMTEKDKKIADLEKELESMRKDQESIKQVIQSDAFSKLLKTGTTKQTTKKNPPTSN